MKSLQATALRRNLYGELKKVSRSQHPLEILRHGKPIAVLSPAVDRVAGKRKPSLDLDAIAAFCKRYGVQRFFLFGSILRSDFNEDSDVDVLIDVAGRAPGFRKTCQMLDDLEAMFGRKVDLLTQEAVDSPRMNPHRRAAISSSARLVYDAAA